MQTEKRKSQRIIKTSWKTFIPSKTNVGDQLLDDTSGEVPQLIKFIVPYTDLKKCSFLNSDLFVHKKVPWQLCIRGK